MLEELLVLIVGDSVIQQIFVHVFWFFQSNFDFSDSSFAMLLNNDLAFVCLYVCVCVCNIFLSIHLASFSSPGWLVQVD